VSLEALDDLTPPAWFLWTAVIRAWPVVLGFVRTVRLEMRLLKTAGGSLESSSDSAAFVLAWQVDHEKDLNRIRD
jgi:hypothetical protein